MPTVTSMDVVELVPGLYFLRFPIGHVYLCADPGGLTLIDTGLPGSAAHIAAAIGQLGHDPSELRQVVLTHFHADHAGVAAEISAWTGAGVLAGQADAPFLRGDAPGPPPDLADWERPIYDQVTSQLPDTPVQPVRVDRELRDGDELDFGGGALTIAVPGHTPGSIACYLPRTRVLIAGDAIARRPDGRAMPGVFNTDRAQAAASFERLASLDADIICCGHAEPIGAVSRAPRGGRRGGGAAG
jgi:glyoxylase-like metal-dependent hydrolase (beta-lactamase superfamily II)